LLRCFFPLDRVVILVTKRSTVGLAANLSKKHGQSVNDIVAPNY
jgi:hypothetical protein